MNEKESFNMVSTLVPVTLKLVLILGGLWNIVLTDTASVFQ